MDSDRRYYLPGGVGRPNQPTRALTAHSVRSLALSSRQEGQKERIKKKENPKRIHIGRAILSNRLHCMSDFISQDCPADGLQVQGRNINGWDQGQLFISQNTSWLAPHGMASFMLGALASAGATTVVAVDAAGVGALDAVALRDQAGTLLALRIVNYNDTAVAATLSFQGCVLTQGTAEVLTLSGGPSAENTPAQPTAVAPIQSQLALSGSSNAGGLTLPPFSFTTVVAHCKATGSTQRSISGTTCDINPPA